MAIHRRIKPNTRILIVFFAAILFIAAVQVGVYSRLFNAMDAEEQAVNDERTNSAAIQMDFGFTRVRDGFMDMIRSTPFLAFSGRPPTETEIMELSKAANDALSDVEGIRHWAVFLEGTEEMLTDAGVMSQQAYGETYCISETFTTGYWLSLREQDFARKYFPQGEFQILTNTGVYEQERLMPVAMRSYYDSKVLVVALLDMTQMVDQADAYLADGVYLFDTDGTLLYTNDAQPHIHQLPETDSIEGADGQTYSVYSHEGMDDITYVKLLTQSQSADALRKNMLFSFGALGIAMLVASLLMLPAVRKTFHPVNSMLELLRQNSQLENVADLHGAQEELEQILKLRKQQEADLAQKNAALSEYVLHSQMKNVYVGMDPSQQMEDSSAFILYIQVQYRDTVRDYFDMTRAELENCLQEMLSATLNRLFETTLIFQLEPGRFAAKVTLPRPETKMGGRMERFMERLAHEEDFACFTVVQSELLQKQTDMAGVYAQVQEAARQAAVCDHSQLLTLPLKKSKKPEYEYGKTQEQLLYNAVREARTEDAVAAARQIIEDNLLRKIDHTQMEMLCVALVNTASHAITELVPNAEKIAVASGVYNTLTSRCVAARDYTEAVTGFIRTATAASDAREPETDQLLKKADQFLKDNYQREFSVEEMANALWVSRSYLSSYYKGKTGMNLSDSIQMFRVQKAVELLKDPEVKVSELGAMVGIPSPNTFLRQFKKYTGMTPKEYRKQGS